MSSRRRPSPSGNDYPAAGVLPGAYVALTISDTGLGIAPEITSETLGRKIRHVLSA